MGRDEGRRRGQEQKGRCLRWDETTGGERAMERMRRRRKGDEKKRRKSVLWIGIVLVLIRIRTSMLMPTRIRIGIKTMSILMGILPQILHMLEKSDFFILLITALQHSSVSDP
jgi:hypothetical protein